MPNPQKHSGDSDCLRSRVRELGIVGAGGGGFPTSVKLQATVPLVIVNAAECEPLLHKDKELLHHLAEPFFRGLQIAMACVNAQKGAIGIKGKYASTIRDISSNCPTNVHVMPLSDSYPAGDEFILVHDITGQVIPPGGLPRDVGAVVLNVETLVNIGLDRPVTHKYLTVAGAVHTPMSLRVPIGMSIGEVIEAAGGAAVKDFGVLLGGVMMAKPAPDLNVPVTKTTGGLVVLPLSHKLMERHTATWPHIAKVGRSACDQCSFCTELCPRYLLGHPIQPHLAMRSLGFTGINDKMIARTLYCSECNLCTMYACPENLDPRTVCVQAKPVARENKLFFSGDPQSVHPHPLAEFRRAPISRLITKLGLGAFDDVGPLTNVVLTPQKVTIPLRQHAGAPAKAVVKVGQRVCVGELLAAPVPGKLGAPIHASIDGVVTQISDVVQIQG